MHKLAKMEEKIGNKEENKVDFHGRRARVSGITLLLAGRRAALAAPTGISRKCFKVKADGWLVKKKIIALVGKVGLRA